MTGLEIFALVVLLTITATVIGGALWLAALPGKLARERNHPQAEAIAVAGWLGLVTGGIAWVPAMVWAFVRTSAGGVAKTEKTEGNES